MGAQSLLLLVLGVLVVADLVAAVLVVVWGPQDQRGVIGMALLAIATRLVAALVGYRAQPAASAASPPEEGKRA